MELNLQKQTITINEVIFDGTVEQPIECDALLPDYCPDIVKVLKCSVQTNIGSATVSGEKLTVEGNAVAHVYYCSDKGAVRHCEYKIPFAKQVELRAAPRYPVITVKPAVDYINCRAVNQRRVDIRGAISLVIRVTDSREEEVIGDGDGCGIQMRREMIQATDLIGQHDVSFPVVEDLDLGSGKAPINTLLRADCRVKLQDHKAVSGKVVAKGELLISLCYQALDDENKLETMEYALPLSQIIDADGADESCVCHVEMYVVSCDIQPRQNAEGEYRQFALDAKIKAVVTCYRHKEIPVATDCYSTQYECGCKTRPVSFIRLLSTVCETMTHKGTLDLPEGVVSVLDAWCEPDGVEWRFEAGSIHVVIRLMVAMFAQMEDGEVQFFAQPAEHEHAVAVEGCPGTVMFEPTAELLTSTYSMAAGGQLEIRCELLLSGCVLCEIRCNSIGEVFLNEEAPKKREQNKLYIYYADEGESIWSIAKRYNTSANAIWEENTVESDVLPGKTMLLIPII